jgi:hypothetical protein
VSCERFDWDTGLLRDRARRELQVAHFKRRHQHWPVVTRDVQGHLVGEQRLSHAGVRRQQIQPGRLQAEGDLVQTPQARRVADDPIAPFVGRRFTSKP